MQSNYDSIDQLLILSEDELKLTGLPKKIRDSIAYTGSISKTTSELELRSECIPRNNKWRESALTFLKDHEYSLNYNFSKNYDSSKTVKHYQKHNGKLDNDFYRQKIKFDAVIPAPVYKKIMHKCIDNKSTEEKEFITRNLDNVMIFCHLMAFFKDRYSSRCYSKKDKTPMSVKLIDNFVGRDYQKTIWFLESNGIIEVDRMYIPSCFDTKGLKDKKGICRHYKFKDEYTDFVVYQITKRTIVNKIYKVLEEPAEKIDGEQVNTIRDIELNKWFSSNFLLHDDAYKKQNLDQEGYNYYSSKVLSDNEMSIRKDSYRLQNFKIGRDKFGHRLYHPFLNIKKGLREFISIDGSINNPIIDINNSHPYFFSLMFQDNFLEHVKNLLSNAEISIFKEEIDNPLNTNQISLFSELVASGKYYDFLSKEIKTDENIKDLNMYYFYGKYNKHNSLYKFFDKNFNFINRVKGRIIKAGGYKRLCQILQRVESKVIIDDVFYGLKDAGFKIIPLHDAIMFNEKDRKAVVNQIEKVFNDLNVKYLPAFNKNKKTNVEQIFNEIKRENFNSFIAKNILFEKLNDIIKTYNINNRVFKEDMTDFNKIYIDSRFEKIKDVLEDEVVSAYYDLRNSMDCNTFDFNVPVELFEKYKETEITKRKFFSRDSFDHVKLNPIEFYNYVNGTGYKTRLKEKKHIY